MLAEAISTGERHLCTRGVFHMVASLDPSLRETWSLPPLATTHDVHSPGDVHMADVIFADQANISGAMFGGDAALVAASRLCRRPAVLASSERLDFHHPIRVGSVFEAVARVVSTGRTSMTVEVELWAETLLSGERCQTAKGLFVMVAVDENQKPVPVIPGEFGTGAS